MTDISSKPVVEIKALQNIPKESKEPMTTEKNNEIIQKKSLLNPAEPIVTTARAIMEQSEPVALINRPVAATMSSKKIVTTSEVSNKLLKDSSLPQKEPAKEQNISQKETAKESTFTSKDLEIKPSASPIQNKKPLTLPPTTFSEVVTTFHSTPAAISSTSESVPIPEIQTRQIPHTEVPANIEQTQNFTCQDTNAQIIPKIENNIIDITDKELFERRKIRFISRSLRTATNLLPSTTETTTSKLDFSNMDPTLPKKNEKALTKLDSEVETRKSAMKGEQNSEIIKGKSCMSLEENSECHKLKIISRAHSLRNTIESKALQKSEETLQEKAKTQVVPISSRGDFVKRSSFPSKISPEPQTLRKKRDSCEPLEDSLFGSNFKLGVSELSLPALRVHETQSLDFEAYKTTDNGRVFEYLYKSNNDNICSICILRSDIAHLREKQHLNETLINFFFRYFEQEIASIDEKESIFVFDTGFYPLLSELQKSPKEKLLHYYAELRRSKKGVDIFSKDFLVIPIQEQGQWAMAVVCFAGRQLSKFCRKRKKTKQSQLLLFSSFPCDHKTILDSVKQYLRVEYLMDSRSPDADEKFKSFESKFKLLIPTVLFLFVTPQLPVQQETYESGYYAVKYVYEFMRHPRDIYSDLQTKPHICSDWITPDFIENKRKILQGMILNLIFTKMGGDINLLQMKFNCGKSRPSKKLKEYQEESVANETDVQEKMEIQDLNFDSSIMDCPTPHA